MRSMGNKLTGFFYLLIACLVIACGGEKLGTEKGNQIVAFSLD